MAKRLWRTEDGKAAKATQEKLSKISLVGVVDPRELIERFKAQLELRPVLLKFYWSDANRRDHASRKIFKQRAYQMIAHAQRDFTVQHALSGTDRKPCKGKKKKRKRKNDNDNEGTGSSSSTNAVPTRPSYNLSRIKDEEKEEKMDTSNTEHADDDIVMTAISTANKESAGIDNQSAKEKRRQEKEQAFLKKKKKKKKTAAAKARRKAKLNAKRAVVRDAARELRSRLPKMIPIMCLGNAGTGVGSTIKGFNRWGGHQLRHQHRQLTPLVYTDEFRTSKTCVYCFEPVVCPTTKRMKNGKLVNVSIHGAVRCVNKDCPSVKNRYAIKSRDQHAAVAICLVAISMLFSPNRETLRPFSRRRYLPSTAPDTLWVTNLSAVLSSSTRRHHAVTLGTTRDIVESIHVLQAEEVRRKSDSESEPLFCNHSHLSKLE